MPVQCEDGYEGWRKCRDINECEGDSPCQNGGICMNEPGNFTCDCTGTGYTGDTCELDINECVTNYPCQNGGACINVPGSFQCDCNGTNFTGDKCNISKYFSEHFQKNYLGCT